MTANPKIRSRVGRPASYGSRDIWLKSKKVCVLLLVFVEKFRHSQCQQKQTAARSSVSVFGLRPGRSRLWDFQIKPLKACNLETKPPRVKRGSICDPSRPVAASAFVLCCLVPQNVMKLCKKNSQWVRMSTQIFSEIFWRKQVVFASGKERAIIFFTLRA